MKKVCLFVLCLLFSGVLFASEYVVKIINNSPDYQMTVRYKECPVMMKAQEGCDGALLQELKLNSKKLGQHYVALPIDDTDTYIKIVDVVEKDQYGQTKAQGNFRLHTCDGYYDRAIILNDFATPYVTCMTESLR